ncbi:MAG: UDP-N-acetylmuramoyl-L-alanine--D-glutamate ligase [Gemmatimonadota bacterium]|jgi:UDP-N-acetylmuramoylalanine--D-glutamate ligase|nr:UDP-N-acetylmuramoyl-L-alanine--D-glutamate ligase [Gemmatimonadota bacterium]MDP6802347.1 UDP-N-acetylmuramoyl-L-alanine--D-glutamate ligase [Gemmatimonadota bacterium]
MKGEAGIARTLLNARGPCLENAVVVVLGYGRSGKAAAALLQRAGAKVRVTDQGCAAELGVSGEGIPGGDGWLGGDCPEVLRGADLVIASPGVPPGNPVLDEARANGLPVRSELELGWWFLDAPMIAVTGTNGKTTTVELLGAMGRAAGQRTAVAGNVGTPLSSLAGEEWDLVVAEVSSFQLATCEEFRPDVAVLLNLGEDHFDWHGNSEHYTASKRRLFANQKPRDVAILNGDDPVLADWAATLPAQTRLFRRHPFTGPGAFIRDGRITLVGADGATDPVFALSEWHLPGGHNLENLLAASLAARVIGLSADAISDGAREFRGLPHRMETVATLGGVEWVNDSKSTNPGSLAKALEAEVPTILIAGGVAKGCDFRSVRESVGKGARAVFLIGEDSSLLEDAFRGATDLVRSGTLEKAVAQAAALAQPGDRVLLSPGCASFDQFDHYAHRGETFRDLVRQLTGGSGRKEETYEG